MWSCIDAIMLAWSRVSSFFVGAYHVVMEMMTFGPVLQYIGSQMVLVCQRNVYISKSLVATTDTLTFNLSENALITKKVARCHVK